MYIYTYIHTFIKTYTHTHIHTCKQTYIHTVTHTDTYTVKPQNMKTSIRPYSVTYIFCSMCFTRKLKAHY